VVTGEAGCRGNDHGEGNARIDRPTIAAIMKGEARFVTMKPSSGFAFATVLRIRPPTPHVGLRAQPSERGTAMPTGKVKFYDEERLRLHQF
jgi:hypothetical protein